MIQEILMALKHLNVNYLVIYEVNHTMCNKNIEDYTNESVIIMSYKIIFQVVNLDAHMKSKELVKWIIISESLDMVRCYVSCDFILTSKL